MPSEPASHLNPDDFRRQVVAARNAHELETLLLAYEGTPTDDQQRLVVRTIASDGGHFTVPLVRRLLDFDPPRIACTLTANPALTPELTEFVIRSEVQAVGATMKNGAATIEMLVRRAARRHGLLFSDELLTDLDAVASTGQHREFVLFPDVTPPELILRRIVHAAHDARARGEPLENVFRMIVGTTRPDFAIHGTDMDVADILLSAQADESLALRMYDEVSGPTQSFVRGLAYAYRRNDALHPGFRIRQILRNCIGDCPEALQTLLRLAHSSDFRYAVTRGLKNDPETVYHVFRSGRVAPRAFAILDQTQIARLLTAPDREVRLRVAFLLGQVRSQVTPRAHTRP